jgi:hypothetical protein
MTEFEAMEIVWKRATPKIPGSDPEFEKAHSMVGECLKNPRFVEFKAVGLFKDVSATTALGGQTKKTSGE